MRLRNKKTGEIYNSAISVGGFEEKTYDSLAELNEEWEDYDEKAEKEFIAMLKQLSEAIDRMNANIFGLYGKGKK